MAKKIVIEKELLVKLYINEGRSIRKISNELGYTTFVIHTNLKDYNLNRDMSEAQKVKCKREGVHNQFDLDIDVLTQLYLDEGKTTYEVADIMKCSQYKVWKTLKSLNINRNVSEVMVGREPWNKGKTGVHTHSIETIRKIRLTTLNRIKESKLNGGQLYPAYNINSIPIIEEYSKKNGYNFQHAENGGEYHIEELGYWVDAYDKEKNTVLEFDELHHNRQQDKDNKRQNEIINHIKCRFIRINENGEEILNTKYNG
jgi:hypothetical protein